jgi:hypothetical protein
MCNLLDRPYTVCLLAFLFIGGYFESLDLFTLLFLMGMPFIVIGVGAG